MNRLDCCHRDVESKDKPAGGGDAGMDSDRLGRLIDQHAAALELYARQWCEASEDVVQEAFLKLAGQSRPPDNPAAWLFRAVRNGAINAAVAARRRRRHEAEAAAGGRGWFRAPQDEPASTAIDPAVAGVELRHLPLDQREVIVAHLWGGLTFDQIGQVAGTSSSTAYRMYAAGLSALRERLGVTCHRSRVNRR
jgi:RNA polymerase sigma factor (sigma-70 family)